MNSNHYGKNYKRKESNLQNYCKIKKVVKKILQTGNQCGINVTTLKQ